MLDFLAPEADWLDIRWCADDDDARLYRELPDAQVIWHVLRPLSGADLRRGVRLRLIHKLGAEHHRRGDGDEIRYCGRQYAGANAQSVAILP